MLKYTYKAVDMQLHITAALLLKKLGTRVPSVDVITVHQFGVFD